MIIHAPLFHRLLMSLAPALRSLPPALLPRRHRRRAPRCVASLQLPALRIPVTESSDPLARRLLRSAASGGTLAFFYQGGSTPGVLRRFKPTELFRLRPGGAIYVRGHCRLRDATRTFRVDRIRLA